MLGLGLEETLLQYLRAVGWSVTAAVGFASVSYTHLTLPTKRIV